MSIAVHVPGASPGRDRLDEVAAKLGRVRNALEGGGFGGAALRARRNFAWLTAGGDNHVAQNTEIGVATILVTPQRALVITPINEAAHVLEEELAGLEFETVTVPWDDPGAIDRVIRRRLGQDVRVARDGDLEPALVGLRSRLTQRELASIAASGALAAAAVTATICGTSPGETELGVAGRLVAELARRGLQAPVLLVASDERIARYRHPIPTAKVARESLMIALVAEHQGLHVALTRLAWLEGRPEADTMRRHAACQQVDSAFRAATVPGRTLAEVLAAGIAAYTAVGFAGEPRLHHQGGTIAYQPREVIATPAASERVEPSMAFAWNPSITGTKTEDTFLLQAGGPLLITCDDSWPVTTTGEPEIWIAGEHRSVGAGG